MHTNKFHLVEMALLFSGALVSGCKDITGSEDHVCEDVKAENYQGPLPCHYTQPTHTFSVTVTSPTQGTTISPSSWMTSVNFKAHVAVDGSVVTSPTITWHDNGQNLGLGESLTKDFAAGTTHTTCAVSTNPNTSQPDSSCTTWSVGAGNPVQVRVLTLDGKPCPALYVVLSKAGFATDSAKMTGSGTTCTANFHSPYEYRDTVLMVIRGSSQYFELVKMVVNVANGFRTYPTNHAWAEEHLFIASPRVWKIASGAYAGQSVSIDFDWAYQMVEGGGNTWSSFFNKMNDAELVFYDNDPIWSLKSLLEVAYNNNLSNIPFDSVATWTGLRQLENELGMGNLFTPRKFSDLPVTEGIRRGVEVIISDTVTHGEGGFTAIAGGYLVSGRIVLPSRSYVSSLTKHEMLHVLGFGHEPIQGALMNGLYIGTVADPKEVAHIQFYYAIREMAKTNGVKAALGASVEGWRLSSGKLLEKIGEWYQ